MDGLAPAAHGPATGPQLDNRRVLAGLVDLALLVPVALLMSALFDGFTTGAVVLTAGWALYYYFALESGGGQTLGKRVMKIRVARADGGPLDMGRVAVRTLLRPIDGIGAYLVGLVVMIATGQRRQRLGDLAAGTVVTEAGAAPEAPAPDVESEPLSEPEPEPVVVAEPEQEPAVEPEPESHEVVEPEPIAESAVEVEPPPADEIVPVERSAEPEAAEPVDEPVPVPEPEADEPVDEPVPLPEPEAGEPDQDGSEEPPRLEIVTSPIELVMREQDEPAEDPEDSPPASA